MITGAGFDPDPSNNVVRFTDTSGSGTVTVVPISASPTQLVANVHPDAGTGGVDVLVGPDVSNKALFSVLPPVSVSRGFEAGSHVLSALPRALTLLPNGTEACVTTAGGLSIVNVDPGSPGFLTEATIPIANGLREIDATPDGHYVFATNRLDSVVYMIDVQSRTVSHMLDIQAEPIGVVVGPVGNRAYVATSAGGIQVWDLVQASPTYLTPLKTINSPDASLRGKMAVDPTGDYLVVPSGAGKLLAFDVGPDTFLVDVSVGPDPRDVAIDPTGQRAYVSDGTGEVTIVSVGGFFKIMDIPTGGALRGEAITPTGLHLYATNRELNVLDVIDLNETSSTYRTVAATHPLGVNPVDAEVSPDGNYAVSLIEAEKRIVVTGIGVGPILKSMSRRAAPAGAVIVFAGEGFSTTADSMRVVFTDEAGGTVVAPVTRSTGRTVTAAVPATAGDGSVIVERAHPPGYRGSNALYFDRLHATPAPGQLRETSRYPLSETAADVAAMSPLGDQLVVGTNEGVVFVDTDPVSATYQQPIGSTTLATAAPTDIVFAPDGKRAFVCFPTTVSVINTDKAAGSYQTRIDTLHVAQPQILELTEMAMSPDGEVCLVYDSANGLVFTVDIYPGSPNEYIAVDTLEIEGVSEMAYNPSGTHAFLTLGDPVSGSITAVDMDSSSVNFRQRVSTLLLESPSLPGVPRKPLSLSFFPDGERCLVLTSLAADPDHRVFLLDTSDPTSIGYVADASFGFGPPVNPDYPAGQRTDVSPRADRAVFHQNGTGLFGFEVNPSGFGSFQLFDSDVQSVGAVDQDYSIDGLFLYSISTWGDTLQIFTYGAADSVFKISGDSQTGAVGDKLPAPLKVRVRRGATPSQGVPVAFSIVSGGGAFAGTGAAAQVVVTNAAGEAQVEWILGATVGSQSVSASVVGAVGSPVTFTADAIPDPNSLPLELVQVSPSGGVGVSVTTTVVATFSRAVDSLTVNATSFNFRKNGSATTVPAKLAFTDGYRKVSLSPYSPLDFSSVYELAVTADIKDTSNGSLENPQTISFTTQSAPPLALTSVSPPSGTVAAPVVLSGVSFNPTAGSNVVYFNNVQATPFDGGLDYLKVAVPPGAVTGNVYVYNGSQNSNTLPFTVLVPSNTTSDEVVATVGTGKATKSVTINPDGSMAYAVSPDAGVVIPIDMETQQSLAPIEVGNTPVSIDIHPDGRYVYVANFYSNTVSIIDTDPNSANYNKVVGTLATGNYPLDVVASPLGDRVYVVTADPDTTQNVDIIDADQNSANHNTVVATVGAGGGVKSVTINPDGSLLYVGNDDGYIVLDASDYSYTVIADVKTGKSTKSVTINPDGSLLIILTADGDVLIVDILAGSANENTVIATVKSGSSTKSVTINPDGTLLYLVQEENDEILVFELNIVGGVSVIDPGTSVPTFGVEATLIDTVYAGEDPETVVFDPRGTGVALVSNSGPQTVTILNTGFVDIELVTDTIMIPGYSQVPIVDLGGLGIKNTSDRDFTFSYTVSTTGPCTLRGGTIANPSAPNEGQYLISGPTTSVGGVTPALAPGDSFATPPFALDVPAIREKLEQVVTYRVSTTEDPNLEELATVLVVITPPVPVFVHRFDATPLDAGVELSWDVAADEGITGSKILRRDVGSGSGAFGSVSGLIAADAKSYVDRDTRAGREYEYALGVVLDNGEEALSQPVRVTTKSFKLALFQNYPNPFNPKTTIAFTLPAKQHVTLTIYNVAGQRVTTLVDGVLSEGYKKYEWDGVNAGGNPVGSGVYFYRLQTGKRMLTRKMILLK
ncbi:MAG: beta-propeller fold lactonase family protein [bacterium]